MQSVPQDADRTARNIPLLYGFAAARAALFLVAVLVPYLEDHVGLTFREILLSEAMFAATMVLAEVPSGWIADHWQRRNVLLLGSVLWFAGIALLWAADSFAVVVVSQMTIGLAASMVSGADSALLYDSLLSQGRQDRYLACETRRHGLALTSLATASAFAGPLYAWEPGLVFAAGLITITAAGLCVALIHEPARVRAHEGRFDFLAMARVVLQECRRNPVVLWAILFAGGLMAATKLSVWTQQAYLRQLEVDLFWFGPVAAATFLTGGIASQLGPSIDRAAGPRAALGILVLAVAGGFGLAGAFPATTMIPLLFVGAAAYGIVEPALKALVNAQVASDRRATILSVLNLVPQLAFIALSSIVGRIVDHGGADDGYLFLAAFAALAAGSGWLGLARRLPHRS